MIFDKQAAPLGIQQVFSFDPGTVSGRLLSSETRGDDRFWSTPLTEDGRIRIRAMTRMMAPQKKCRKVLYVVEEAWGRGGQGLTSTLKFVETATVFRAVAEFRAVYTLCNSNSALGLIVVPPKDWKAHYSLVQKVGEPHLGKEASVEKVKELYPDLDMDELIPRLGKTGKILGHDHNKADAILIGLYGLRLYAGLRAGRSR